MSIDEKLIYAQQIARNNLLKIKKIEKDISDINIEKKELEVSSLKSIKGIWDKTIAELYNKWIRTPEELKNTSEEDLRLIIKSPFTLKNILDYIKK